MKDLCNNMIRENESLKVRLESMRYDWENEVRTLKNRYRIETNELKLHVTALQPDKEYEKSSSDVIRESKREIQDLKKRLHEKEELVSRLRKDKTDLMDSRFEQCESLKKMLDLEKLEKRNIMIENERLNTQETKNNDKNSNAKGSVYEFWEKPEEFEEILLYHEKKYENVLRDKQIKDYKYDIEAREIKEMIRKKESQLKEKEKICEKLGKEKEEIEKRALENGLEVERIKEENFGFLDKINKLKEENQVLNQKFQEIGESKVGLEELTKQKEKTRQYKEKLKEANEKIMSLLEEKIKTKENNEVKTEKKEKGIEKSTFVPEERLNNRDFMKDLTNMRILDENRIIRENANRFKEHLLMMN